mmetsp:Transcript_68293/g.154516  ORF Transcript_68293/g.154516 Transcript_68293/m.154516 type:complete len:246 (-) Transcript_68293:57-794(-)
MASLQVVGSLVNFKQGGFTPYGRFYDPAKHRTGIASRLGMTVIYSPSFLVGAFAVAQALAPASVSNGRELLVASMIAIHFAKRLYETWFVHVYSGDMDRGTSVGIGVYYALMSFLVIHQQAGVGAEVYAQQGEIGLALALALFGAGEIGNLACHCQLAKLRSKEKGTQYVLPSGGLFGLVVSPHYMFEVIVWLGIAVAAAHLNACLLAVSMACYLAGRADSTWSWYKEKFEDFPESRWRIMPGVF